MIQSILLKQNQQNIDFGYRSPVKKIAKHCAYTGKEFNSRAKATFEHIKPHSKGGRNGIDNCLAVLAEPNHERGNIPFDKWLKSKPEIANNIQKYLNELRGVKIEGQDYVETVKKTLNKEANGIVSFTGNKKLNIQA